MTPGPGVAGTPLAGTSDTSAAIAVPAGVTAGQTILVDLYLEASRTVTPPAGFTEIGTAAATSATWHHRFWKRATGSDAGTYTFTWAGAAYRRGCAVRYPGCVASGTPFDTGAGAPVNAARSTAGTVTPAVSLTTQGADRLVVWSGTSFTSGTWTQPAGFTERYDSNEITGAEKAQPGAGATGSITGTSSASDNQTAWLLALIPATTGVSGTAAAPLGGLSAAAAGVRDRPGVAAAPLGALTATAAGVVSSVKATAPLGALNATAAGRRRTAGTAAAALGGLAASALGRRRTFGSASAPLGGLAAAAAGTFVSYLGAAGRALNAVVWRVDRDTLDVVGPPLLQWERLRVSPIANAPGSCQVVYPAGAPGFSDLYDNVSATPQRDQEIEVWLAGNAETRTRWLLQQKTGDDLRVGDLWTFDGVGLNALLAEVLVGPQATETLELLFSGVTYGTILITAVQQAQLRDGVLEGVTWDFTTTHDSDGVAWASTISDLAFAPDATLLAVADTGPVEVIGEFEIGPDRVLRAWNYGTRGVDRSGGVDPLRLQAGANLSEASRRESSRPGEAATAALGKGAEGQYQWASNPTAQAERGRRVEVAVDAGQTASEGGVLATTQGRLEVLASGVRERTHGVVFGPGLPLPGLDYDIGDVGLSVIGNTATPERIAQWSLNLQADGRASGTVRTSTLIEDALDRLRHQLERVRRGAAVVGTSIPSPDLDDGKSPAQVTGVTASSSAYADADGATWAAAVAAWSDVTTNADATAADDIVGYLPQFRYTAGAPLPTGWQPLPQVADNAIDFDRLVAGTGLEVRVAAIDKFDRIGAWSAAYALTTGVDATPPPVPSTPVVESYLGILTIAWDGLGSAGQAMPPDFDRVDIYASTSSGFTPGPSNYVDSLRGAGTMPTTIGDYGDTFYARLVSVDRSGNPSAASAQDSAVLVQAGDGDVSALSIGKLTVGIMSALMTVSGIIRTAASGSRVELDTNGLRCYLGSTVVFDFSIPTSVLTLVGKLIAGVGVGVGATIEVDPDPSPVIRMYPNATSQRVELSAAETSRPGGGAGPTFRLKTINTGGDTEGPQMELWDDGMWFYMVDAAGNERGGRLVFGRPGGDPGTDNDPSEIARLSYQDSTDVSSYIEVSSGQRIRMSGSLQHSDSLDGYSTFFVGFGDTGATVGIARSYGVTMQSSRSIFASLFGSNEHVWVQDSTLTGFAVYRGSGSGGFIYFQSIGHNG